jgi:hypothetical protein
MFLTHFHTVRTYFDHTRIWQGRFQILETLPNKKKILKNPEKQFLLYCPTAIHPSVLRFLTIEKKKKKESLAKQNNSNTVTPLLLFMSICYSFCDV